MNIKINQKRLAALFVLLLLPCMGVSKCNPTEQLADEVAAEQTREMAYALETFTPEPPTQTPGPTSTITVTPLPPIELPEGLTWEDLAGHHLPPPPLGLISKLSDCENVKSVKVEGLGEDNYQAYKENIQQSGWEKSDSFPDFDPQVEDKAAFTLGEEIIQLAYDRQKAELVLQRGLFLAEAETLSIMAGRQWGDVMAVAVPEPAAGRMVNFSEVSNGEETTARRVILEGVSEETLQKWLEDIGRAGWAEQMSEFQDIFQGQMQKTCGPAFDAAADVITPGGETTISYFLDPQTNAMIELTYNDKQVILTWLTV